MGSEAAGIRNHRGLGVSADWWWRWPDCITHRCPCRQRCCLPLLRCSLWIDWATTRATMLNWPLLQLACTWSGTVLSFPALPTCTMQADLCNVKHRTEHCNQAAPVPDRQVLLPASNSSHSGLYSGLLRAPAAQRGGGAAPPAVLRYLYLQAAAEATLGWNEAALPSGFSFACQPV
jgi:hypothetical protein